MGKLKKSFLKCFVSSKFSLFFESVKNPESVLLKLKFKALKLRTHFYCCNFMINKF